MYIEPTTQKERRIISSALCGVFCDLEDTQDLLNTIIEECFSSSTQKEITTGEAEWVAAMLRIVRNNLFNAIETYYLTVAESGNTIVKNCIKNMDQIKTSVECDNAYYALCEVEHHLPEEKRTAVFKTRLNLEKEPDCTAVTALLKQLNEAKNI